MTQSQASHKRSNLEPIEAEAEVQAVKEEED